MGTFRTLSADDVRQILGIFGVGGYVRHSPIAAGTINTNFAVDAGGRKYFLRINEGKAHADVEREAAIVSHLAARGVPTPAPLATAPGTGGTPFVLWSGVFVSVFPWVEGHVLRRCDLLPDHARAAGRALARLHGAGADFRDHRPGRYEVDEIERRFERIASEAAGDSALAGAVSVLGPELARLRVARAGAVDLPLGLIHADLFIDNVLYDDAANLTALLDFEQASWGKFVYDVAVSLLAFGFGVDDFRREATRAFIDGYREIRIPTASEQAALADELCFAACRFTVTRITDVYLRRGDGAPAGKDFNRYLLRLRSVKEHCQRDDGLLSFD